MFDGYIICGTPRSGSTLLCGLLASMKQAGDPDSYFRPQDIGMWAEQWGLPRRDTMNGREFNALYLQAVIRAGRAGTGMFGLRLMRENLEAVTALLDQLFPRLPSDRCRFERAFGLLRYIHLSREDMVAQAISLIKAEQTGLWHIAPDGTEIERVAPPKEPHYDYQRIRREVMQLESWNAAWHAWFDAQGIEPLRVNYRSLSANPAATLISICEALGVQAPQAQDIQPSVAKLSDAISSDWQQRFRADSELLS